VPFSFFASLKDKLFEAYGDYRITKELFMSIYSVFIVNYDENKEVTDHLFSIFQLEDESHVFDFRELFVCMAPSLRGTLDEKIRFLFEIFDLKKTGFILRENLRDLIKYNYKSQFLQLSNEKLEVLLCLAWRRTLVDNDHGLSLSDFIYLCETQPFTIMI
jgi:Ca2+-binding EF-hand superfamily protein